SPADFHHMQNAVVFAVFLPARETRVQRLAFTRRTAVRQIFVLFTILKIGGFGATRALGWRGIVKSRSAASRRFVCAPMSLLGKLERRCETISKTRGARTQILRRCT